MKVSPHADKQMWQRDVCGPMVQCMIAGRWPGVELRGAEELALPLWDGSAVVVKFHDATRQTVATVYVREAHNEERLARGRLLRGMVVRKWCEGLR